jgi:hypothetical protein
VGAISPRRSLTCGDENYVLSGRSTFSDGGKLEIVICGFSVIAFNIFSELSELFSELSELSSEFSSLTFS